MKFGIDIDKNRHGARGKDRRHGGDGGVGNGNDFIARSDPQPAKGQGKRIRTAVDADAVAGPAVTGKRLLERNTDHV